LNDARKAKINAGHLCLLSIKDERMVSCISSNDEEGVRKLFEDIKASCVWPISTDVIVKGKNFLQDLAAKRQAAAIAAAQAQAQAAAAAAARGSKKSFREKSPEEVKAEVLASIPIPVPVIEIDLPEMPPKLDIELPSSSDGVASMELLLPKQNEAKVNAKTERKQRDQNDLLSQIRKVINKFDKAEMAKLLNRARMMGIPGDTKEIKRAREICYTMSDAELLELKLAKALYKQLVSRVKPLLDEALRFGLQSSKAVYSEEARRV
jgi:hypothetical protein